MNLLAITKHPMLLERLRTAFEGAGHTVTAVPDHLHALANEAWNGAHLMLVDADGDPLDGYRLCHLLRAESRSLFRNLPDLPHPGPPGRRRRPRRAGGGGRGRVPGGGRLDPGAAHRAGPAPGGGPAPRAAGPGPPCWPMGLPAAQVRKITEAVRAPRLRAADLLRARTCRRRPGNCARRSCSWAWAAPSNRPRPRCRAWRDCPSRPTPSWWARCRPKPRSAGCSPPGPWTGSPCPSPAP